MARIGIRWRITLWNTAAFALVLLGFGLLIYSLLRQTHYNHVDAALREELNWLLKEESSGDVDLEHLKLRLSQLGERTEGFALLFNARGELLAQSKSLDGAEQLAPRSSPPDGLVDSLNMPGIGHVRRLSVGGQGLRDGESIVLLTPLSHVDEEMWEVVQALLLTVPVTLTLAAALAYFLARKALSPVDDLRRRADEITAERLDQILPVANPVDELGQLAQTINAMIARIDRSFYEVRRFTADASHELRTPIAVIRSEAELAIESAQTVEEAQERLESILDECNRLAAMTDQLLTLSRHDAGIQAMSRNSVSLGEIIENVSEVMQPLASGHGVALAVSGDDEIVVRGDRQQLRQVFYNLLDNAIKCTPSGGRIDVAYESRDGFAVVDVRDTGIGICAEDLPRIFDRFYRGTRSFPHADNGAGLGLSIVKSILASHDGQVAVESHVGRGTVFRIRMPVLNTSNDPDKC